VNGILEKKGVALHRVRISNPQGALLLTITGKEAPAMQTNKITIDAPLEFRVTCDQDKNVF